MLFNLNEAFTAENGHRMQEYVRQEAQKVLKELPRWFEQLNRCNYVTVDNYPIDLTDSQGYKVEEIVRHKREGKFALANHEYIELILRGPVSWALLTSWTKILCSVSLVKEAIDVLVYCELILHKRGKWMPTSRSASMLRVLHYGTKAEIKSEIVSWSGIPNFQPLPF